MNTIIKDIKEAISTDNKPKGYDTPATVTRVEGSTVWVHIAGGVDETPVKKTINAKEGDTVQVRISNGSAWLMGNATAPPTDDAKANEADKKAAEAKYLAVDAADAAIKADMAAQDAVSSAETARTAAETAQEIAEGVHDIAVQAQDSADRAEESAESAYNSASTALTQLGIVEDIVGVLELIANNGVYALTQDTEIKADKWYFTLDGNEVTPTGEENPHSLGWYEIDDGIYSLTEDISVIAGKTYYTITASVVDMPTVSDIGTYYQLESIDSAIQNYVSSHIAYADGVLSLQNGETKVSLSTDSDVGLIFYNDGQPIAQYGSSAIIGDPTNYHIVLQNNRLSFFSDSNTEVAFIDGDQLFINKSVVIQQMDVGDSNGQWSWKVHLVNGQNNMYLKWLG